MNQFVEKLAQSLEEYRRNWQAWQAEHSLDLGKTPSSIGWKVADEHALAELLDQLMAARATDQVHIGLVNDRYIASAVVEQTLWECNVLKLMQVRPGSSDPAGLDHVDFTVENLAAIEDQLQQVGVETWEYESNDAHQWISLDFNGREAKFVDHHVLDVCIQELEEAKES